MVEDLLPHYLKVSLFYCYCVVSLSFVFLRNIHMMCYVIYFHLQLILYFCILGLLHKAQKENEAAAAAAAASGKPTDAPQPSGNGSLPTTVTAAVSTTTPATTTNAPTTTTAAPVPEFRWDSYRLPKYAVPSL